MTARKLISIAAIVVVLIAITAGSGPMADDIISKFRRERALNKTPHLDVTHLVRDQTPIGMSVESATKILQDNRFKIIRLDLPDGSQQLIGSRFVASGMTPFTEDEYRIVLTMERGRIKSVLARIFLQTL